MILIGVRLRLGEPQPEALQRDPASLTDDEVVEQLDIEQLSRCHDLDGEGDVCRRGRRVAGGVVVDGNDSGGVLADRITKHFRHSDLRLINAPAIDRRRP